MEKRFRKWLVKFIGDADKRIKEDYLKNIKISKIFSNYSNNHIIQNY